MKASETQKHEAFMRLALREARRGFGSTSPNPMVGAVLVAQDRILATGYHRRAGEPHAEVEAIGAAAVRDLSLRNAALYVTLEPCCTIGRTPACTEAIARAGIRTVVVGATDPNPRHCGEGFKHLRQAGIRVVTGVLESECAALNEAFNHWIVHRTPFVTVKAAMTLDGKIADRKAESKWITGERARAWAMKLRQGADAILVGIGTVLADDPGLTLRGYRSCKPKPNGLRRLILDSEARTPLSARLVRDADAPYTTIFVGPDAPAKRVKSLARLVRVITVPPAFGRAVSPKPPFPLSIPGRAASPKQPSPTHPPLNLNWILQQLGSENVTSLLVEGGGEVHASFLNTGLAQKIAFFYAPKILGGAQSRKAVAGAGAQNTAQILHLKNLSWRRLGPDWLLTATL